VNTNLAERQMIQNLVTFVNVTVIGTWCQRGDKRLGDKRLADPTPIGGAFSGERQG